MAERPQLSIVSAGPPRPSSVDVSAASTDDRSALSPSRSRTFARGRATETGGWLGSVARAVVLVVVVAIGAVAVAPRLVKGDLPVDPALIGTSARGVVRADRDYALVDSAATAALRRAAAERSLPVWDLDDERSRRDVAVLQKALVRIAVALEAQRGARDGRALEFSTTIRAALDPVRAVVAGELAEAGIEAPRDEAWRALLSMIWQQPSVVDVVGGVVSEEAVRPILSPGQQLLSRGVVDDARLLLRALGRGRDERSVLVGDVLDEARSRDVLRERLTAALLAAGPGDASSWTSWSAQASSWLAVVARGNITWNAAETDARAQGAASSVPPVIVRAHRGEIVLRPGEVITTRHQLLAQAMGLQQADDLRRRATLGTALFIGLLCSVIYLFGARRVFQRSLGTRDVVLLGSLLALELAFLVAADAAAPLLVIALPGVSASVVAFAIPVALGPMCARVTLPPDVALLLALVTALLGGVVVEAGMTWAVVAVLSSTTGVAIVTRGPRRLTTFLAGAGAGLVGVCGALTLELFRGALGGTELLWLLGATLMGGVASGALAVLCVPLIELMFGYVTDRRLSRLADLNHPLLKDLIVHAPGTWHHSVRAAVLAERAAVAVGANPLLARVMALYHDIGKIAQPQSFRENQQSSSENPHDRMLPEESAAVLRAHVEQGLALAREHRIPPAVSDVIVEHHADLVMESFLEKARSRAREPHVVVDESAFRYTGTVPSTRESALVLLADQIESAARQLGDAPVARLDDVVDAFVNRALATDLLEGCDLSLKDLGKARVALKTALRELSRGVVERRAAEEA